MKMNTRIVLYLLELEQSGFVTPSLEAHRLEPAAATPKRACTALGICAFDFILLAFLA